MRGKLVSNRRVSHRFAISLNETNARARVPSGLTYRAMLSSTGSGVARTAAATATLCVFFGLDPTPKNPRTPPRDDDDGGGGCRATGIAAGGEAFDLACAVICESRRIVSVSVNSSLLCSILKHTKIRGLSLT